MSSFIPWQGGKTRLADTIVRMMPEHTAYVEPFIGGGSVLFSKYPSKIEVINDINKDLITLYRVAKYHKDEFCRQFENMFVSREEFENFKITPPEILTDIQRAARFFYIQKIAFGGKIKSQSFGTSALSSSKLSFDKIDKILYEVHGRLTRVVIEKLPYEKVIEVYDRTETLFYLDPPYEGCENDYGKNIFNKKDYAKMAAILGDIKGKFILSINDTPTMRETFKAFKFIETQVKYSIGKDKGFSAAELIYKNF